jgi:hypothetical protein
VGWSAYLSAGLAIIGTVFLFLFYAVEVPRSIATGGKAPQVFGTLNDIAGLFQLLFMLPLTVALYRLAPSRHRGLGWAAMALGVVGLLTAVIAQALLVARVISFAVNLPFVLAALGLVGGWMVLANHLGRGEGTLPPRLTWLGELTGAAFVPLGGLAVLIVTVGPLKPITAPDLGAFAQQHPVVTGALIVLAGAVFLAYFVGILIWLVWLGRRLLAAAAAPAHVIAAPYRRVAS